MTPTVDNHTWAQEQFFGATTDLWRDHRPQKESGPDREAMDVALSRCQLSAGPILPRLLRA